MAIDAGSVYSSVRIRLDQLDADLKGVFARLNQLESSVTKTTASSQGGFKNLFNFIKSSGIIPFVTLGAAVAKVVKYLGDSTKVATDAQETFSKFDAVFSEITERANATADAFADSFDLADATARKMISDTGNIASGMGATQEEALAMSVSVNTLAADLASFTNYAGGAEGAAHALTSAMLGEREQAKSLGIVIREVDVQQKLMERGQDELTGNALTLAKAQATLDIAMGQAKNALGDYARTADSAANSQKRAAEASKQLQIQVGTALRPAATAIANLFTAVTTSIGEGLKGFNDFNDAMARLKKGQGGLSDELLVQKKRLSDIDKEYVAITNATANEQQMQGAISGELRRQFEEVYDRRVAQADVVSGIERQIKAENDAKEAAARGNNAAKAAAEEKAKQEAEMVEFIKARQEILDAYQAKTEETARLEREGAISFDEANSTRISSMQAAIASLNELYQTDKDNSPRTLAMLQALIGNYKELKEGIEGSNNALNASAERAQEIRDANSELYYLNKENTAKLYERGKTELELLEIARKQEIASIAASDADQKYKDRAIASTNALYDALKDDAAWEQFGDNASRAFDAFNSVFSALTDLVTTLANNQRDAQLHALEDVQEAEREAIEERYDALEEALDAELQAKLYEAGLAEAATMEQLQAELEAARAAGDSTTEAELEEKIKRLAIEEEYAAKQKALEEQRAAEEKDLEEKQAKERAQINYKAEMAAWRMKVIAAYANAAQAIVGALSAPPYWPWNAGFVAAATVAGGANVAAVKASKPVLQYATGGIVPGTRTTQDSVPAMLKPREAVLTEAQQAEFMRLANGGGGGASAQPIMMTLVVQFDSIDVARSVAQQVSDGKVFIAARGIR